MSIDLSKVTAISDQYGSYAKIEDASGRVLWMVPSASVPIVLEVEKITSDTYAAETTYTGEQFILLDIYPKTNGTVKVTYGGLTKTITDTSGAEEPNAQQVYFGTFNGVSDEVATPASGELTIEGDYAAFATSKYAKMKLDTSSAFTGVIEIKDTGLVSHILNGAFGGVLKDDCSKMTSVVCGKNLKSIGSSAFYGCTSLKSVALNNGLTSIGDAAFFSCRSLESIKIPSSVTNIGQNPWQGCFNNNAIAVASNNPAYKVDGNCLVEIATNILVSGYSDASIPSYIEGIKAYAFCECEGLTTITIPSSVKNISLNAFYNCHNLTNVVFENPHGWSCVNTNDSTDIVELNLTDPAENAVFMTDTYSTYIWTRI